MNRLAYQAEECNVIPTASTQNNAAFVESAFDGSILNNGHEEEEKQLHEADKCNAKIHYFSRTIAEEHGIIRAAVLSGFAYKLKFHKLNKWKNRFWYYDPVETLRTHRWPYLSDGCISETTDYLAEKQLLIKDCNNKESYDRTVWYAMDDDVRARALSDLIWFDVRVVKKLRNILPGAIYHNLRFHLRKLLRQDPECIVPYHKLNQAMLARLPFVDVATIKRWVKTLKKERFIIQHPKKRSLYTLADEREYRPIDASVNANGASVNANDALANGASVNANDALANAIGVKVNANDALANDNTQYETNEKPVRNQSQKDDCVPVCKSSLNGREDNHAIHSDHKLISDAAGSVPHRGIEKADAAPSCEIPIFGFKHVNSFDQLLHQSTKAKELLNSLHEEKRLEIIANCEEISPYFVKQYLPGSIIVECFEVKNRDQLVRALRESFAKFIGTELPAYSVFGISNEHLWQLFYYPQLESLVRAFDTEEVWESRYMHTDSRLEDEVRTTHNALLSKVHKDTAISPQEKTKLFKQNILRSNRYGWELEDGTEKTNLVQPSTAGFKKIEAVFEEHPELSAGHLNSVLGSCLDVIYLEEEPDGFDKHWAARQGGNLEKFAKLLEKIVAELDLFSQCPIGAVA